MYFITGDVHENNQELMQNAALDSCRDILDACETDIQRTSSRKLSKSAPSMSKKKSDSCRRQRVQSAYPCDESRCATSREVLIEIEDFDLDISTRNEWPSILKEQEGEETTEVMPINIHQKSDSGISSQEHFHGLSSLQNKTLMKVVKSSLPRPSVTSIQSNVSELFLEDEVMFRKVSAASVLSNNSAAVCIRKVSATSILSTGSGACVISIHEKDITYDKHRKSFELSDIPMQTKTGKKENGGQDESVEAQMERTENAERGIEDLHHMINENNNRNLNNIPAINELQCYKNKGFDEKNPTEKINDPETNGNDKEDTESKDGESSMSFFDFLNESYDSRTTERCNPERQQSHDSTLDGSSSTRGSSRLSATLSDAAEFMGRRFSHPFLFNQTSRDTQVAENRDAYGRTVKRSIALICYLILGMLPQAIVKIVANFVEYNDIVGALTVCEGVAFVYCALLPYVYVASNKSLKNKLSNSFRLNQSIA